jgi:acetyl esterase/lipase
MAGERTNAAALSVQPLHPSMLGKLDPEYIDFHNKHVISIVPPHTLPWDPSIRNAPTVPGASEPLPVGKTHDINITNTKCRVFTPEGQPPKDGWPVFIWFHGGAFCSRTGALENSSLSIRGLDTWQHCVRDFFLHQHVCP